MCMVGFSLVFCNLDFTFTPSYPEEGPLMEIETETLSEERVEELIELKDSLVTNYLMINCSPLSGYHSLSNFQ